MKETQPLKFHCDLREIGNGWVVQNLQKYGNSVLPSYPIELMSESTTARLLSVIIDEQVAIRKTQYGYIAEVI